MISDRSKKHSTINFFSPKISNRSRPPWVKTALISPGWRLIPLANWHDALVNRIKDGSVFRPAETAHPRFVAGNIELDHRVGWIRPRRPRQNRGQRESFSAPVA
jgi:hypothetical protein